MDPYRRLGIVAFAIVAVIGLRAASAATSAPKPDLAPEMALGNPKAKVTLVEYGSASCPHCAAFNNDVFPELKKKYIDTGKVRYVFREMITDPAPFAETAFMIARCAGDKNYFTVLDEVFHQQEKIYESGQLLNGLLVIAGDHGMDTEEKFEACTRGEPVKAMKLRAERPGMEGVKYTPTFVIGKTKLEGNKTLAEMSQAIDPLLGK